MKSIRHSRLLYFTGLFLAMFVWLANNSNPPTGRTGAPFDTGGTCANNGCHTGNVNNYGGTVVIDGLPSTIAPQTVYPLTITLTPTAGNPIKGGFQLVAVDGNNVNAGGLTAGNAQSGVESFNGRQYLEHRGGKLFSGNPVTWSFNWTSPSTANGNTIKFYYIANFANGTGNENGDFIIPTSDTYAFSGPPPVTATITSTSNVLCAGGNTGSATVEGGGGAPPYTYLWSNGQTGATATGLVAGNYNVVVTGASGSGSASTSTVITQPAVLNATVNVGNTISCTQSSSSVSATVTGGTSPYSYQWSNGDNTPTAFYTATGPASVVITDSHGCTRTANFTITGNVTPPTATAVPQASISCLAPTTTLSGAGSSTNATYQWSTSGGTIVSGATTLSPVVSAAGVYVLQVTSISNGCTATASVNVTSNVVAPGASASASGNLNCTTTSVSLLGNSPTSGVTYIWRNASGTVIANQQNTTTSTAGVYTVTTTSSNGCTSSASVTVTANTTPPNVSATGGTLTCVNPNVTISASSTTPNATYLWTGPSPFTSTLPNPTVSVAGTYTVVVTGANGCQATATAVVTDNSTPPTATASNNGPLNCVINSVQLTSTTNAASPAFQWSGPALPANASTANTSSPGVYTVIVTNTVNGCTSTATTTVAQNITPPTVSIATPANLNCNTTAITLNAEASSIGSNFIYAWATVNGNIVSGINTLLPVVSAAGTYTLGIVNTVNGCTATGATTVVQTPAVTAGIDTSINIACNGGAEGVVTALPGGGDGTYTYVWSNNATTISVDSLPAGTYLVTIMDGQGCTATTSATITQPTPLVATVTATGQTAVNANDGTATVTPSGGTPPYTVQWSTGDTSFTIAGLAPGVYSPTITDANGCTTVQTVTVNSFGCTLLASIAVTNVTCNGADNGTAAITVSGANLPVSYIWSTTATTQSVTGLSPGTIAVSLTDANGCPATLNATITEPAALAANATATNTSAPNANDGAATATPTGGTMPYTFLWNTGPTTASISGLSPGQYSVVVTDANQCTAAQGVTINAVSCNLSAAITSTNVTCAGGANGEAAITVLGGISPYTYAWSNMAVTAVNSNLMAGVYTVTGTDAVGCIAVQSVTIGQPSLLVVTATTTNATCADDQNGSVAFTISGGTMPYVGPGAINSLGVGNYTTSFTDANGCVATVAYSIAATDNIAPTLSCPGNISLCGADIVSYPLPIASDNCSLGGNTPLLSSGLPSGAAFNDGITTQVFKVTDAAGNTAQCSFTVTVFPLLDILYTSQNDVNNSGVGSIDVTAVEGTPPYTYIWQKDGVFFSNAEDLTGLTIGTYLLNVTDANGCGTDLAPIVISNTVGTSNPAGNYGLRLYPNPASSTLYVQFTNLQGVAAEIVDARGQLVQQITASDLANEISVAHLPAGLYCLKVRTAERGWQVVQWVKGE